MLIFSLVCASLFYRCAALISHSFSDVKNYPEEWLQRCGDGTGQIPIFQEKMQEFETCYKQYVDVTLLIEGFVEAMASAKVPDYVKEKCHEIPEINQCLDAFAASIKHCFNEKEKTDMQTTVKVLKATLDFICENNGEKVLIFLSEKGFQCIESKQQELHACVNNTSKDDFSNSSLPDDMSLIATISYTPSTCRTIEDIYECSFEALEGCQDKTPSLLLKALKKWILKDTPCNEDNFSRANQREIANLFLIAILVLIVFDFLTN